MKMMTINYGKSNPESESAFELYNDSVEGSEIPLAFYGRSMFLAGWNAARGTQESAQDLQDSCQCSACQKVAKEYGQAVADAYGHENIIEAVEK